MDGSSDREQIQIVGAEEGNLRNVSLNLPLGQLVVFAGVSGSGKSTFAVDVVHAESQRRYLEAASLGARKESRAIRRPNVTRVHGVPPTLALDQRPQALRARETVGEVSGAGEALRVLFGCTGGLVCPKCGQGVREWTQDEVVAWLLSLPQGTRVLLETPWLAGGQGALEEVMREGFGRIRVGDEVVRIEDVQGDAVKAFRVVVDRIKVSSERRPRMAEAVRLGFRSGSRGLVAVVDGEERFFYESAYCGSCETALPSLSPALLTKNSHCEVPGCCGEEGPRADCSSCKGTGLHAVAGAVRWSGKSYQEAVSMPLSELQSWLATQAGDSVSLGVVRALLERLEGLCSLALAELTLGARARQLSQGELQRLRVARHLTTDLAGVLYVLDEPCAGLDEERVNDVVSTLRRVVAQGNSVLCVSHQDTLVGAADWVVCWGPGAGAQGGRVLFEGTPEDLRKTELPTGKSLQGVYDCFEAQTAEGEGSASVKRWDDAQNRWCSEEVPLGCMVALWGANATGKTSFLRACRELARADEDALAAWSNGAIQRVLYVDGSPSSSGRGMLATYAGVWTPIRKLLAATPVSRVRAFVPGTFSLAVRGGRCEACHGTGQVRVALGSLPGVEVACEVCDGRRFQMDVLDTTWRGLSPDQLLGLTVLEAQALFVDIPMLARPLQALCRVGLGYLKMDHPLAHLSGGEAARIQLGRELGRVRECKGTLYLIEHPEQGLHARDMHQQFEVLRELVRSGGSVWFTTHASRWVQAADHSLCFNTTRYRP